MKKGCKFAASNKENKSNQLKSTKMAKNINAPYKIVCAECGSDDIMEKMWFNPNTAEVFGWDEDDLCYCKRCQKMTEWKEIKETN